jgi:hypothetical protein
LALYELALDEDSYRVRVAAAQYIGQGGDVALNALRGPLRLTVESGRAAKLNDFSRLEERDVRAACLAGWILPSLWATANHMDAADTARKLLAAWLSVCDDAPPFDACLAQGLKYEANRSPARRRALRKRRRRLNRTAETLGKRTTYWYTQVTAMHALCLVELRRGRLDRREIRRRVREWVTRTGPVGVPVDGRDQHGCDAPRARRRSGGHPAWAIVAPRLTRLVSSHARGAPPTRRQHVLLEPDRRQPESPLSDAVCAP